MANVSLFARVSPREVAIAAHCTGMTDASVAEISRYAVLLLAGYEPDEARKLALFTRTKPDFDSTASAKIGVSMPEEWIRKAQERTGSTNLSYVLRYGLALLGTDEDEAHNLASKRRGRPRKTQQLERAS